MTEKQTILTITGSDSTGGSGVQADIKTISELGGYAVSAMTSITVQNTLGIQEFYDLPADIVSGQIEAIINDIEPQIVKVGMIRRADVLGVVVNALTKYKPSYVIYDPIVFSSKGDPLMTNDVVSLVKSRLLPLCDLVIVRRQEQEHVLADVAFSSQVYLLDDTAMHGLSNRFSSAVAVYLSEGKEMGDALEMAKTYINQQIVRASDLKGRGTELYHEFLEAVSQHIHTASDVHFYADSLNVSSRYLAQVTRRISGQTPKAIIDDYLIKEVERLLSTTDKTVQEIAYELGFSSQAHLTKFFRKLRNVTPSQYRKG